MFERSDEQFVNAARYRAVRRNLMAQLGRKRKGSVFCITLYLVLMILQGLLLFLPTSAPSAVQFSNMFSFLAANSTVVIEVLFLALVVAEIARFYSLDTKIKMLRMLDALDEPGKNDSKHLKPAAFQDALSD